MHQQQKRCNCRRPLVVVVGGGGFVLVLVLVLARPLVARHGSYFGSTGSEAFFTDNFHTVPHPCAIPSSLASCCFFSSSCSYRHWWLPFLSTLSSHRYSISGFCSCFSKYHFSITSSYRSISVSHCVFICVISADGLSHSSYGMPRSTLTPLSTSPCSVWNVCDMPLANRVLSLRSLCMLYSRMRSHTFSSVSSSRSSLRRYSVRFLGFTSSTE
uniref:Uncharacterized protein n=1 Tax=Anopheles merus TaxID=30066 RepID=A0A182V1Y0_ANOME